MILGIADHPSFKKSLAEFLDFASRLKVDLVELKMDRLELLKALSSAEKAHQVKQLLDTYNFKHSVHAPSINVNLASLNPTIRKASEKVVTNAVRFAVEINAEFSISHVGRLSKDYPKGFLEKALKNAVETLKRINKTANDLGIVFTLENDHKAKDYILAGYPEQLSFLIENVGCKLTFDVGHANTLKKPEEFIEPLKAFIANLHLHNNNGKEDSHLSLRKGNINLQEIFEKLGDSITNTPLTVECHSFKGLEESVALLREKLG
ncbi:hypothetical protein DRO59_05000 [Candidatus Bathyarchaeota archaeon]|nr:MAG: hypothetical protein DRO59_05000 [Candidatus Bathyarchaeota archaeon]